ncbi:transposon Ty3-G Gag-Pol polyprotein [Nephila pilipes]|uniref:Transposon Ty3-G Gag-Pol polyprotein n=1 Tax=Nephila pilipes TaxID=299642 RepID=A0A8X6UAB9_NEPPI|nr:transposon Ty3-G Gag-Pol polyprotein [Nephila pilipes]
MTDQRDHRYRVMDEVSQVLRKPDVQIANQQRIKAHQILATSICFSSSTPNQSPVLKLAVNGIWGIVCADTGSSHTIAGETLYLILQREATNFQKTRLSVSLADGQKAKEEVFTTSVVIKLEGHVIRTPLIALPNAKGNGTLLGNGLFTKSWHCSESQTQQLVLW